MNDNLFDPLRLKNITLKNRFIMSAAGGGDTGDAKGNILAQEVNRYVKIAQGGVGLIVTGGVGVHPHGTFSMAKAHLFNDEVVPSFKKLAASVHNTGAKIAVQIYHNGAFAGGNLQKQGLKAISASHVPDAYPYKKHFFVNNFRAATEADIWEVIHAFGNAAKRVYAAGFDAVLVHGCHDTLLQQFLSPCTNKRTDAWGGSITNRIRLHQEILKDIRTKVGPDFPVLIKLGVGETFPEGLSFADGKQAAILLAQAGYDAIEISQGQNGLTWDETVLRPGINKPEKEAYFRNWGSAIHRAIKIPTILTGGIRSYEVAKSIIENDDANLIGMCRPLIKEPELINNWKNGNHKKSTCTSCNKCVIAIMQGMPLQCYLDVNLT